MAQPKLSDLEPRRRRRLLAGALLRALLTAVGLVVLYYLVPVDGTGRLSGGVRLVLVAVGFIAVVAWEMRTVLRSKQPTIRAIEALACTVPLFILLFAGTYFVMSTNDPGNFSQELLTRTDSLYLAVTTFATVGYGDISPVSQSARVLVMSQMILDLLILGLGINAFVSAARAGRQRQSAQEETESTSA
jgi:voltage-gated potassium channel